MKSNMLRIGAALAIMALGSAHAASPCGEIKNAYGPFDYRKGPSMPFELQLVEGAHFTADVEQNVKGATGARPGSDLDYTLRAWPNHYRALASMSRQGAIEKSLQVQGARYPVDCYFLRAFQLAPDDGMVHALYGNHLFARGKTAEALAEFRRAVEMEPDNPTINYNAGLAYFQSKDYDKALLHAKKAYALKFPLPGLKNKLIAAGKWDDKPAD